jgi:hypothetical protein
MAIRESGKDLVDLEERIGRCSIRIRTTMKKLLDELQNHSALLVEGEASSVPGVVTLSDLNKHAFRASLYLILAKLESNLALFIQNYCPEHERWIRTLPEDKQAAILGNWELAKLNDMDIGPLAGATLTDLLTIIGSVTELRSKCRFESKSKYDKAINTQMIKDIRNQVMHPVRPLIIGRGGLEKLVNGLHGAFNLNDRVLAVCMSAKRGVIVNNNAETENMLGNDD